jgi:hypothetical protein
VVRVRQAFSQRLLLKDTFGEVLALLQFAQLVTEQSALIFNRPEPALGFSIRGGAPREASLDVARERKPHPAKD